MSTTFSRYSSYYDLLYNDKDYVSEVGYVRTLLAEYATKPITSLIELGCGTGIHACALASHGLEIVAIDLSNEMLAKARDRVVEQRCNLKDITFEQGDARNFRASKKFDAVISLFHVLSYQTEESDLRDMIQTAAHHLDSGGIFIFDFWYGPAVLWQHPVARIKRLADAEIRVTRFAEPVLHDNINVVDVNYSIFVEEFNGLKIEEIKERHRMRYLFLPEIDKILSMYGLERLNAEEWITRKVPSVDSWGVCIVARKK